MKIRDVEIANTISLGWYHNEEKDELQLAKIAEADRSTHLYIVGATGTGKTKFLEFLVRQDIQKGNGFGIIDPHGDLVEDIKGFLAFGYFSKEIEDISKRVILIDPTDPHYTVAFNPLERIPGVSVAEQAGELVSAFKKIWADSWGSRMEDLMRNTMIALGEAELTLSELPMFVTRRSFRKTVLRSVSNPTTQDYFRRFDSLTDRSQITWIEPVMNKINAFMADERMRQMFSSAKSSFQLREMMDNRKHLLIKLDKGKLKGSADLLGSLFMAKIQMAAFSRSDIPKHRRIPFYLYIDEFQNFATDSFKIVLSEARKYGLSLIMAHQSLSQISEELRSLILSSAGLQVYFRVNRQDAQLLSKELFEYSGFEVKSMSGDRPKYWSFAEEWEHKTEDLQLLRPRTCWAKHKILGGIVPLYTYEMESGMDLLEVDEENYSDALSLVPFGRDYLIHRNEVASQSIERQRLIAEKSEPEEEPTEETQPEVIQTAIPEKPVIAESKPKQPRHERPQTHPSLEIQAPDIPSPVDTKVEREHRRLQHLIKRLAEESGYRAIIEEPTNDGQGRVDVGLERDGSRTACEICITTSCDHELANIRKCLASGYDRVIMCSPEKKSLTKIKSLCLKELKENEHQKILFLAPDEVALFFDGEAAERAGKEDRVKGYKVKVSYLPVSEEEKKAKREAIARVLLGTFRR